MYILYNRITLCTKVRLHDLDQLNGLVQITLLCRVQTVHHGNRSAKFQQVLECLDHISWNFCCSELNEAHRYTYLMSHRNRL